MSERGLCRECRHSALVEQFGTLQLVCRRNPPVVLPLPRPPKAPGEMPSVQFTSMFPSIEPTWTCGELDTDPGVRQ
ncbi:MAG TPA: hypothetical protein VMU47_06700 [Caldimonas sp.]|nr:hypothetical protein [Caldimonas sp.]